MDVGKFFLDSGAHSLYTLHVITKEHREGYAYYESKDFWKYVDRYARFLKKWKRDIDFYANVDVIFNPELSWKVLKYLENEHGLNPVPVIHYNTPMKWIDKHLEQGYKFLGIGGLGQEAHKNDYIHWADRLYTHLCPKSNDYLPLVKTHGFAMTAYSLMIRYPWWSVDSVSWAKSSGFGSIFIPHKRQGKFVYDIPPYVMPISFNSTAQTKQGRHFKTLTAPEKQIINEWLEHIEMPLGSVHADGTTKEYGVLSEYHARALANIRFFDRLCEWLPKWPWPFTLSKPSIETLC